MSRRFWLIIMIASLYIYIMSHNPPEWLKSLGYNHLLDWYSVYICEQAPVELVYNPGLKTLTTEGKLEVKSFIPDGRYNYGDRLEKALKEGYQAVVECSGMDAWHTSSQGKKFLDRMYPQFYRVVVFDGGHHLPTLGLQPDVILVPVLRGYAVHSYTQDGIKVDILVELAREAGIPTVIATVPRWGLVKRDKCLDKLALRTITRAGYTSKTNTGSSQASPGVGKINGRVFAYVGVNNAKSPEQLAAVIKNMQGELHKVYLAFDYGAIDLESAIQFTRKLSGYLKVEVKRVNEPVKITTTWWGEKR